MELYIIIYTQLYKQIYIYIYILVCFLVILMYSKGVFFFDFFVVVGDMSDMPIGNMKVGFHVAFPA